MLTWIKAFGFSGILDIAFMSLFIYSGIVWFQRARAAFVLTGIVIVSAFYLVARQFDLVMTAEVFEKFFAVIFIALIVIFQEELKQIFEQVALWSLNRRLTRKKVMHLSRPEVETLVRTATELSHDRIGALIVIRGRDMILRHLEGGTDLNGEVSEPVLKSLFDPHSIGHDGALIIEGNHITKFSVHLPLSKNIEKIGKSGTRHAAALGLSELSDALCIAVSEERGTISVAYKGEIEPIPDPEKLTLILERFYQDVSPRPETRDWHDFFIKNSTEKIVAVGMAMMLWFVLVYGSKLTYKSFTVPVNYASPPEPWKVVEVTPNEVSVTFRGSHRDFYFLTKEEIKLFLNLETKLGPQKVRVSLTNLIFPKYIALENLEPREIKVELTQTPQPAALKPEEKR